ncbi:sugar phosphate isomerase/epimerase [Saliphagus sp. LR7]|uniref:sugar phosphate isomerase/epimerase family protein n=1 Tax=Saliphagus sp. LR7 TaxID=2282654 RepID=UPI000DF7E9D9|nr:TIM barrel protein [Saliphagus sp. LR7]
MVRTAIQLFTLRDVGCSLPDIIGRVGGTAFDGVEFYDAHFDDLADPGTADRTRETLAEAGLSVAGAHVGIDRLESSFDEVVSTCERVGCSTLVIPSYDGEAFSTVNGIEEAADRIAGLAADLAEHDVDLLYHNHTFEFVEVEGSVAFERFVEFADGRFGFEPDVGLAAHADYDPLELLAVVGEDAPVVHLTDTVPGDDDGLHADVGKGVVDAEACAEAAVRNGAEWLVCENGRTDDGRASLAHGSEAFADLRDGV